MILFTVPSSPFGARIRIQAVAKGVALDIAEPPGGLGSQELFAINPFGKVPVLRTDEGDIIESAVIQEYLEDCHPEPNLRGTSALQVAEVRSFTRAVDLYLFPALFGLRAVADSQTEAVAKAVDEIEVAVGRLARLKRLKLGNYLCGSLLTLADCALAPAYFYTDLFARRLGFRSPFECHHVFTTWWAHVNGVPAVGSVIEDLARIAAAPREVASE
jgi:glutathione S-transferase